MSKYEYYIQLVKWYRRQAIKTFASILANNGIMDISEVAQLLGHVSEQTLINHYIYPTKSNEARRERLENALAM